jgi:hypothetical protein
MLLRLRPCLSVNPSYLVFENYKFLYVDIFENLKWTLDNMSSWEICASKTEKGHTYVCGTFSLSWPQGSKIQLAPCPSNFSLSQINRFSKIPKNRARSLTMSSCRDLLLKTLKAVIYVRSAFFDRASRFLSIKINHMGSCVRPPAQLSLSCYYF